jgi:hypothetical protein
VRPQIYPGDRPPSPTSTGASAHSANWSGRKLKRQIYRRIPGTREAPIVATLAPVLVEQAMCLVNPVQAHDRDGVITTILVDNAMRPEDRLVSAGRLHATDHLAVPRTSPVQCRKVVRRIAEIACVSAFKGAQAAVTDPTAQG